MTSTIEAVRPAPPAPEEKPKADPRYLALRNFALSLSVFNILGYTILGFEQPYLWPFLALATGYTFDVMLESLSAWTEKRAPKFRGRGFRGLYEFLLPAHITSLAVNMLFYANDQWWPVMFGVLVGVGGKYILKAPINGRMRHFMNPSNLGITAGLLAFGTWASIAPPYQFTEYANTEFRILIPLLIAMAGTVINAMLTKRVLLIVGWAGGFVIQALVRYWIWDHPLSTGLAVMSGVAFILYTNYMITDPGTTPSTGRAQFMFGAGVSTTYGVLMVFNVTYTLFYATTLVCAARGISWWVKHYLGKRDAKAEVVGVDRTPPGTAHAAAA
ncbi:enediyne biosynthesis protein [Actinocorallia sp. A-T 12471]|uniref:enediyne biosynthesis protein n=1 Tax=Actinocorallia sp. A-T 12471 TaxID=3089813 RepID=UPI0029CFA472|nr:enediyne biosynthesis protein [Actinocorallia sp. A-T 12471]MDX6741606.1 enediyne biosynthesis protein [Actinocorallia sp. A-T 12471]